MLTYLPVSNDTLNLIKVATEADYSMGRLKTIIREGWPETKDSVRTELHPFFLFRDELSFQDGLVFKGERLVIPASIQNYIIERLHSSHIGF